MAQDAASVANAAIQTTKDAKTVAAAAGNLAAGNVVGAAKEVIKNPHIIKMILAVILAALFLIFVVFITPIVLLFSIPGSIISAIQDATNHSSEDVGSQWMMNDADPALVSQMNDFWSNLSTNGNEGQSSFTSSTADYTETQTYDVLWGESNLQITALDKYFRRSYKNAVKRANKSWEKEIDEDETKHFTVIAYTEDGLECATELTVAPDYVPAPSFTKTPKMNITKGVATVSYALELNGRKDESLITWYRCTDKNGANRLPVSVSRLNEPEYSYTLVKEDVGYYLMAAVAPKHLRCVPGKEQIVVSNSPIKKGQVNIAHIFETDFQNFPCKNQPQLLPGFWTIGGYKPLDTAAYDWQVVPDKDYWIYGPGMNGSHGTGLLQDQKGARLLYTPLDGSYGDMAITLNVDASKTAGQGFGSATGQYLDLYIKFDTCTLTGYALRIIRTTKYSNAVDFILMKYENGVAEAISQPVSSICYRTNCTLTLTAKGGKLTAHASTTTPLPAPVTDPNLKLSVDLEADIASNTFGGTGIQHTGSCGESTTMLHYMKVEWE